MESSLRVHLLCLCVLESADAGDGEIRLAQGAAGPGYEYGRLEVFLNGLWSDICSGTQFTPNSATLACRLLGYGGGSRLFFNVPFQEQLYSVSLCFRLVVYGVRKCASVYIQGAHKVLPACS